MRVLPPSEFAGQLHLEIVFLWEHDRWSHQWLLVDPQRPADAASQLVLTSCEGDSQDAFPASPPLQQIHQQELGGGQTVMGVGMAGRSHWSAAFAPQPEQPDAILADLACLRKTATEEVADSPLGSTYRCGPDWSFSEVGSRLLLKGGWQTLEVRVQPKQTEWSLSVPGMLRLSPANISTEPNQPTCWSYQLRLSSGDDSDA